jgi:hypothetical protein
MREVSPGDLIFSFVDTRIVAIGASQFYCYESPKPAEFGEAGLNWEAIGWRIRVNFSRFLHQVRPKDHMQVLGDLLPDRYSPLQPNGNGVQSIYLTQVPESFAEALIGLVGTEASLIATRTIDPVVEISPQTVNADLEVWEHHLENEVENDTRIADTEREALIIARRGQGLFKERVMLIEKRCRITRVNNPIHLRASHCKPWRDSNNDERLDGENGLLLTAEYRSPVRPGVHQFRRLRCPDCVAGCTQTFAESDGCRDRPCLECRLIHRGATTILGLSSERGPAASYALIWHLSQPAPGARGLADAHVSCPAHACFVDPYSMVGKVLPLVSTSPGIVLHTVLHQIPSHRPPRMGR